MWSTEIGEIAVAASDDDAILAPLAGGQQDEVLATSLRAGDPEAMAAVFDRYADRIYNFCFRRTASWAAAEDAMAACFLEIWKARRKAAAYDGDLLPWMYGVAGNVCRNLVRGQRRQRALTARLGQLSPVREADHADAVAGRIDDERRMAELADAVGRLGPLDREVLMLVVWDDLTYAQAAQVLGVPVGTVRSRLSRSRSRLADLMAGSTTEEI